MSTSRQTSDSSVSLDKDLVVLFDGHALFYRAFYAIKTPMSVSHSGELTGAIYGITSSLLKSLGQLRPAHAAVAFDRSAPTFRHKMYEEYKAQRPPMPDDMRNQFERVREVVEALGLPILELDGYEADDILGYVARKASEAGLKTIIVTGDQDAMQLVSPSVRILYQHQRSSQAETLFDEDAVREKYGLGPDQIADLKALMGDPSDNIPGVPRVGGKTATALLQEFGSVQGIYDHLEEVKPERVRELLRSGEEAARQGLELTTIVTEVPLEIEVEGLRWSEQFDRAQTEGLFQELEFNSLIPRLPDVGDSVSETSDTAATASNPGIETTYRTIDSPEEVTTLLAEIGNAPTVAVMTPFTTPNLMDALPVGVALAWAPGKAAYIPLVDQALEMISDPAKRLIEGLRPLFEETPAERTLAVHVAREALSPLANVGLMIKEPVWDTSVAAHLLGKPSTALPPLVLNEFGVEVPTLGQLLGTGKKAIPFSALEVARAAAYACTAADYVLRMQESFEPLLREQGTEQLFRELEMPLAPVMVRMERYGILMDAALLGEMSRTTREQVSQMEAAIYEKVYAAGGPETFNINSPKQLGEILFEKLGLPPRKRTQTGYSTDASVLEELRKTPDERGEIVGRILEYRELSKLASTYLDALPAQINARTGRIHTSFNQTGSATGRIASSDPNLQNIPIRTETGRRIRLAFVAPEGSVLTGADYSQVELRVLAHLAEDPVLQEAFRAGEDVHAATASRVLGIPLEEITSDHRRIAKAVNFGIVYGMSGFGLATRLDMDRKEADEFISGYFDRYPKVRSYMDATIDQARRLGYVETLLGRRRFLPEINAGNPNVRAAAERMAINMPVQGTAADIIKLAMLRMQERLDATGMATKMLLQIHDELLFESPEEEYGPLAALVDEVMPNVLPELSVPLAVEIKTGRSWGELE